MKVQTQSKRFYQTLSVAIATLIGIANCNPSVARPRGGGFLQRGGNVAPSNVIQAQPQVRQFRERVQEIRNSPQFQERVQEVRNSPQFQERVQEIRNSPQFQERVQEIKNSPQFQQRVQEIRQNLQTNPEAQQRLQELQQSRQQFKVERREDWQKYLNDTRDERQDRHYYNYPYYWNVGYGYDYFWDGYYPNYFVPFGAVSLNLFANDFDRYHYDYGRYYDPNNQNYTSSVPENARVSSLPEGFITVGLKSLTYYYYLGTFYIRDSTTGNYAVTPAPVGAIVPYIPTEYTRVIVKGREYYKYAGIYYRPTYIKGQRLYEVVKV